MSGAGIRRELSAGGVVAGQTGGVALEYAQRADVPLPPSLTLRGVGQVRVMPQVLDEALGWRVARSVDPRLGFQLVWDLEPLRLGVEGGALPFLSPFGVTVISGSAYGAVSANATFGNVDLFARADAAAGFTSFLFATLDNFTQSGQDASVTAGASLTWRSVRLTLFAGWLHHQQSISYFESSGSGGSSHSIHGPMAGLRLGFLWPRAPVAQPPAPSLHPDS